MNNIHFSVNGLQNMQMKTQLKNVLKDMDGVRNVNVDSSFTALKKAVKVITIFDSFSPKWNPYL
ncbi:MAG: hypothetical protein E7255_07725 [Lachnospiraceae bacterium]|jgi:hypothetical protein|nr:hypothetical protein [Lachnospiraceae bacterium]